MHNFSKILHGGDYNPEQWQKYPEVIDQDFALFRKAAINTLTVGVFSWATLEPEEGSYAFGWLDDIFERVEKQQMHLILATPSGGKPNWLALHYPEVRRVTAEGQREPQQARHNHCLTSPVYRQKVHAINAQLAKRYGQHASLILWHISNEFGGYCYCDLCLAAFREWLKEKYLSLEALNDAYWSRFWSHTFSEWEQIRTIDKTICGLSLDWKRFMTAQCRSFIRNELEAIRPHSPDVPSTINFMGTHPDYDYHELAREIDVVSWDAYPAWHTTQHSHESNHALNAAFRHDVTRGLAGGKPFLLMESTPSQVNWAGVSPLLRPGMLRLASLQAVAHGSDSVCYFQMRKSRGSWEQFHGAVIDHAGHGNTRVFQDVATLGASLEKMQPIAGAKVVARVAVIFDWETRWIYEGVAMPVNAQKAYAESILGNYKAFWDAGINVDVIHAKADLSGYDLVVAPILFMVDETLAERLTRYVESGGTLVTSYGTGVVGPTGLALAGGMPGPLRQLLGIWVEEFDALEADCRRQVEPVAGKKCGLSGRYQARHYLDLLHLETAEAMAVYGDDFYAGYPALTRNHAGRGQAWHIASRNDDRFTADFFGFLIDALNLHPHPQLPLANNVSRQTRCTEDTEYLFLMNFNPSPTTVALDCREYREMESGAEIRQSLELEAYGSRVLVHDHS